MILEAILPRLDWMRRAYQDSWSGGGDVTHWTISNAEFLLGSAGGSMVLFGPPRCLGQATAIRVPMVGPTFEGSNATRHRPYAKWHTRVTKDRLRVSHPKVKK